MGGVGEERREFKIFIDEGIHCCGELQRSLGEWLWSAREALSSGSLEGKNFERVSPSTSVVTSWSILTHPSIFSFYLTFSLFVSGSYRYWLIAQI